jgi:histidine phosphotransferase ChpT
MGIQVDLAIVELVCSRLCHDMVGPVGAATNGIELLRELSGGHNADIIDMTDDSARTAWRRLEFFRVAFGSAGGREGWGTNELCQLAQNMLRYTKARLDWVMDSAVVEVEGRGGKLVLNLILLMAEAMPRGGVLTVRMAVTGDVMAVSLNGAGQNAKLNARVASTVTGQVPPGELDNRVILAHLAWLQALDAKAEVEWEGGEHSIAALARIPHAVALPAAAE